jgi:hypothetical protein
MPAYLVTLPSNKRAFNVDSMIVFAANAAGARAAAAGAFDGDGNALWNTLATVTEIVVGTTLADSGSGWSAYCRISGGAAQTVDPIVVEVDGLTRDQSLGLLGANRLHIGAVAINAGGTGYSEDEILTFTGGTFTRAATARVTSVDTGVIDGIELVDPGEYSVLPTLTAVASTNDGSGNDDATMDLTQAAVGGYEALLAQMVTGLSAFADLGDLALDLSEAGAGPRLLTLASITDDIGDAAVEFEIRRNGTAFAPLVSTIVDEGIAGAVLTVAIPASPIAPPRVITLRSV